MNRVGIGLDVHAFAPGRPLVLGGVTLSEQGGLAGHSDADVLTHAICDALLGAAGEGDLGRPFPSAGATHYPAPMKGITPLLEAIAAKMMRDNDIQINPATDVVVTPGGKWATSTQWWWRSIPAWRRTSRRWGARWPPACVCRGRPCTSRRPAPTSSGRSGAARGSPPRPSPACAGRTASRDRETGRSGA